MLRARLSGWANVYVGLASKTRWLESPYFLDCSGLARSSETVYTRHANGWPVEGNGPKVPRPTVAGPSVCLGSHHA